MQVVRLTQLPHQTLKVRLDDQYFKISIYQKDGEIFADVEVAQNDIVRFVPCLNCTPILCRDYFRIRGQLMFVDAEGKDDPFDYRGLGSRWFLVYFDESEVPFLQAKIEEFLDDLVGIPQSLPPSVITDPLELLKQRIKVLESRLYLYIPFILSIHGQGGEDISRTVFPREAPRNFPDRSGLPLDERMDDLDRYCERFDCTELKTERDDGTYKTQWLVARGAYTRWQSTAGLPIEERVDAMEAHLNEFTYVPLLFAPGQCKWLLAWREKPIFPIDPLEALISDIENTVAQFVDWTLAANWAAGTVSNTVIVRDAANTVDRFGLTIDERADLLDARLSQFGWADIVFLGKSGEWEIRELVTVRGVGEGFFAGTAGMSTADRVDALAAFVAGFVWDRAQYSPDPEREMLCWNAATTPLYDVARRLRIAEIQVAEMEDYELTITGEGGETETFTTIRRGKVTQIPPDALADHPARITALENRLLQLGRQQTITMHGDDGSTFSPDMVVVGASGGLFVPATGTDAERIDAIENFLLNTVRWQLFRIMPDDTQAVLEWAQP